MSYCFRYSWRFVLAGSAWFCLATAGAADDAPARRAPWTASRVVGSPLPPEPYQISLAFANLKFDRPTCLVEIPSLNRMLVTEMSGKVLSFAKDAETRQADLVVDLQATLPKELSGRGVSLFDAEFHPNFSENQQLFVCYVHPGDGGHTRVSRVTLDGGSPPRALPDSEQVIITWPSGGHNGGCLEFDEHGYLYISTGDGSGPNPPDGRTSGQTVDDLLGAVLRIDVNHAAGERAYAIPAGNPFVDLPGARPEIWAYGFRNPWKFGVDPQTGNVFVADNGWESWEMIHRLQPGGNGGWPIMEGRASLRSEVKLGPTPIIPPVKDHPHSEANSVIGGPVYRGDKLTDLDGSFIYGDYITGTIWAIRPDLDNSYSHTTLVDTDQRIVAFTQGSAGEVFVLDYDYTGQIYELLPSGLEDTSASFPRRLSETGLFDSLATMQPAAGVVPYALSVDPWMDGAKAERWVAIPGDGQIQLAAGPDGLAEYPEGTVLVKHLTLAPESGSPPIRLETQLLHYERGSWRPYSYLWDEEGQDALLVDSIGASRPLRLNGASDGPPDRTWQVSTTNECKLCHNAGSRFVLGFTLNQLDGSSAGNAGAPSASTQLKALTAHGVLAAAPEMEERWRLVDPHDASQPLDDRARTYLHVNCGMCHHPGGNAIVSFYLRRDLTFDKLNTNKGTGIGTFGMREAKIIAPGDPYRSVLFYRMSKLGYARMPYIGSRVVDGAGVALIEQWIRDLPHEADTAASAPASDDSAESKALRSLASKKPPAGKPADGPLRQLVSSTEGSLALVAALHRGSLAGPTAERAVALGAAASGDVRGLFDAFIPESQRKATLGANIDPQVILSRQGDQQRGKLIFFSDGARCRNCHELDDRAKSLGPTLREITKKYPKPAELLQHALQPSLKVEEVYAAYTVVTDDGRVWSGLIVEQTDQEVVLKTLERQIVRIARDSIDEMVKSEKSLMPDRILSDLTAQEAADLFEYIRTQVSPP